MFACLQAMSGTIALVGTLSYVLAFAIGVGPVPGILVSEINAAAIRGMHCTFGNYNRRHSPPFVVIMLLHMPSCTWDVTISTARMSAGSAVAFAMVTHWVCNFGIGQLFLPAVARYGVSTVYLGFAAVCVTAALFVAAFVLETKGRTLEQIEAAMAA